MITSTRTSTHQKACVLYTKTYISHICVGACFHFTAQNVTFEPVKHRSCFLSRYRHPKDHNCEKWTTMQLQNMMEPFVSRSCTSHCNSPRKCRPLANRVNDANKIKRKISRLDPRSAHRIWPNMDIHKTRTWRWRLSDCPWDEDPIPKHAWETPDIADVTGWTCAPVQKVRNIAQKLTEIKHGKKWTIKRVGSLTILSESFSGAV